MCFIITFLETMIIQWKNEAAYSYFFGGVQTLKMKDNVVQSSLIIICKKVIRKLLLIMNYLDHTRHALSIGTQRNTEVKQHNMVWFVLKCVILSGIICTKLYFYSLPNPMFLHWNRLGRPKGWNWVLRLYLRSRQLTAIFLTSTLYFQ